MILTTLPESPEIAQLPNGLWTAKVHLLSRWYAKPEDAHKPHAPRLLTEPSRRWAQVLGVTFDELQVYLLNGEQIAVRGDSLGYNEYIVRLVSRRSFVVVRVVEPDEFLGETAYDFIAARLVDGAGLGRKPYLTRRPAMTASYMRDPSIGRNRALNWVQLSELHEITGIEPADIIRHYAPFSLSTVHEPNVPLARGERRKISCQSDLDIIRVYTHAELPGSFRGEEAAWGDHATTIASYIDEIQSKADELWVTQSFANRVIRLASFGYRPGQRIPDNSCRIEAALPKLPQGVLPATSAEQLKEGL